MLFRDTLARALAEKGMTHAELVDKIQALCGREIEESVISKYVNGTYRPQKSTALDICKVLGLDFREVWQDIEAERTVETRFHRIARYMWDDLDLDNIIDKTTRQLVKAERRKSDTAYFRRLIGSSIGDIDWVLSFDHGIYPTDKPVTRKIMQSWLEAENKFSFTLKHGSELLAFCVAIPLEMNVFLDLIHGRMAEADLPIKAIDTRHTCLYVYSFMGRGSNYAGEMLARLAYLFILNSMESIGGLVVTTDAEKLAQKIGLKKVWQNDGFPTSYKPTTYLGTPADCPEFRNLLKQYRRYVEILKARF